MSELKASLDSLRIDRNRPAPPSRGWIMPVVIGILLLAVAGGGLFWWMHGSEAIAVQEAIAEGSSSAGGGGSLDATGYVVARRQAVLSAKIQGRLVEANLEEGDKVSEGQVVARLDDSNNASLLLRARADEARARAALSNAMPIYERSKVLLRAGALSAETADIRKASYDDAVNALAVARAAVAVAQVNQNDTIIRAPFSGVVTVKNAQVGEIVAPSGAGGGFARTGVATIVDMNSLEVEVDVSENYIERIRSGMNATVSLNAYPDWQIPAAVIAVIPTADRAKGTVQVRVGFKGRDARILPQMGARVTFQELAPTAGATPAAAIVTVPRAAVIVKGDTGTVFVIGDGNIVEQREVALGTRTEQSVRIRSGVAAGERLASGDLSKLRDESRVTILQP